MRVGRLTGLVAVALIAIIVATPSRGDDVAAPQVVPDSQQPAANVPAPATSSDKPAPAPVDIPTPPSVTVIPAVNAHGILGRDVRSPADENMGRISDVIVDRGGQVRAAVIDFGGFLGVGSRKIVVDWNALHFWNVADKTASMTLELTRDQVRAAPEYKDDQPIVVLGASGILEPLRFRPAATEK